MTSRMDRYDTDKNTSSRRLSKNKELYDKLYTNSSYAEFTNINSSNVIELTSSNTEKSTRRGDYQRKKDYIGTLSDIDDMLSKNADTLFEESVEIVEKDYDINSVLANAKKNRGELDDLEKKRKLRTMEYNILADLTEEKLKERKEKKKEVLSEEEEVELAELIHTITSNTMRQEIDNELLGGLMPTELDETIVSQDLSDQLKQEVDTDIDTDINEEEDDIYLTISKLDGSFYTKSMDLSDQDLVSSDEDDEYDDSFAEFNNKSTVVKVIIAVAITIIIALIIVLLYNVIVGGK